MNEETLTMQVRGWNGSLTSAPPYLDVRVAGCRLVAVGGRAAPEDCVEASSGGALLVSVSC